MVQINDIKNTKAGISLEDTIMCYENIMLEIDNLKSKMDSFALDDVSNSDDLYQVIDDINGVMSTLVDFSFDVCDKYYDRLGDNVNVLSSVGNQRLHI